MDMDNESDWQIDLKKLAKPEWLKLLENPGGAIILAKELPKTLPANKVSKIGSPERRVWELIGLYYRANAHFFDAVAIYLSMYDHFLKYQLRGKKRVHKGMPLVWVADCYFFLGYISLSKRFLMLTLLEDAIERNGDIDPIETGSYFRLAWRHGMTTKEINNYATQAYKIAVQNPDKAIFPEWILQELDQNWQVEKPTPIEASLFISNHIYINFLISNLGEESGEVLERLSEYILSCMPGCRTVRRRKTRSTDYDIICSIEGSDIDFRSEFGRYFVCECKDWGNPADFSSFAKFCRVLDSIKAKFGILFSKNGISGEGKTLYAEREQLKIYQDRGIVIVVIDQADLKYIASGGNFIALLREKYESVRLDIRPKPILTNL
jgi:hypothetical protein